MKRDIYQSLISWMKSPRRKPLVVKGARQTGKTWILKEFGSREFQRLHYFNFEEEPTLGDVFAQSLSPRIILEKLSMIQKARITPREDLIFFDEIQASNNALNSLKYFCEEQPDYHVVAAGSLLGIKMAKPLSFPVGKVNVLEMFPMTFGEFLEVTDDAAYRSVLRSVSALEPIPEKIHTRLVDLLKTYYFVGGMPEPVSIFADGSPLPEIRAAQEEILKTYALDFAKHAPTSDVPKITSIWESIPTQLARENKKFFYSSISKNARAREYENALQWLLDAGLVSQAFAVTTVEHPLAGFAGNSGFKLYALDVGLLAAMARMPLEIITRGHELFRTWHGAFVESYIAQQMTALTDRKLHYWKSETHQAEVDFLVEDGMEIYPLEVKAGINPKSKSLQSYANRFHPGLLLRSTLLNLKHNGDIINFPLYAVENLSDYIRQGLQGSSPD